MIFRSAMLLALLSVAGCGERRPFDEAAWRAEASLPNPAYNSVRPTMLADIKRRLPIGTEELAVRRLLGPSEDDFPDLCREVPEADHCLLYAAGASGVDPYDIVIAFKNHKLLSYRLREL